MPAQQVGGRHVLEQEAARAGAQGGERVLVEVEGREHQHARAAPGVDDPARGLDAVHLRHAHVHEHDIRVELRRQAHCLLAVPRLAHDRQVVLRVEHHAEADAQQRLIVDQEHRRAHSPAAGDSTARRVWTRQPPAGSGPASTVPA